MKRMVLALIVLLPLIVGVAAEPQQTQADPEWAFPVINGALPEEEGPFSVPGSTLTFTECGDDAKTTGVVTCCAFSPEGKCVVSGCQDNLARRWNIATGRLAATSDTPTQLCVCAPAAERGGGGVGNASQ